MVFIPKKNYLGQVNQSLILHELAAAGVESSQAQAIGVALSRIFKKLAADERLNYEAIEGIPAGGKIYATKVIGLSTKGYIAADVDYLCDGSSDNVQINEAITAIGSNRGRIVLLEGTYDIDATLDFSTNGIIDLVGMGTSSTVLNVGALGSNPVIKVGGGSTMRDFSIDGAVTNGMRLPDAGTSVYIENIEFIDCDRAIYFEGIGLGQNLYHTTISDCRFSLCGSATTYAIDFNPTNNGTEGLFIYGNSFEDSPGTAIGNIRVHRSTGGAPDSTVIALNGLDDAISVSNSFAVSIIGNMSDIGATDITLTTCSLATVIGNDIATLTITTTSDAVAVIGNKISGDGIIISGNSINGTVSGNILDNGQITLSSVSSFTVTGNIVDSGSTFIPIHLTTCHSIVVSDNKIGKPGFSTPNSPGIRLDDCDNCLVDANLIVVDGNTADMAHPAIRLHNDTNQCKISQNMIRARGTCQWQYAVSIEAAAENDNLVIDNDGFGAWTSAAINNAGTGTVVANGNR